MLTDGVRLGASSLNTGLLVKRATAGGTGVWASTLGVAAATAVAAAAAAVALDCLPDTAYKPAEEAPPAAAAVLDDKTEVLPAALPKDALPV